MMRLASVGLVWALAFPATAACLQQGQRISGEFRLVESHHPNGTLMRSPFVVLDSPICLKNESGEAFGRWIQLLPKNPSDLARFKTGDSLTIEGDYDVPMTAWHIGDVMAFEAVIVGYEKQ